MFNEGALRVGDVIKIGSDTYRVVDTSVGAATVQALTTRRVLIGGRQFTTPGRRFTIALTSGVEIVKRDGRRRSR